MLIPHIYEESNGEIFPNADASKKEGISIISATKENM